MSQPISDERLWDLVRYQRGELLDAGLITLKEYTDLVSYETADKAGQGSPSPRRLESYDAMRKRLDALDAPGRWQPMDQQHWPEKPGNYLVFDGRDQYIAYWAVDTVTKPGTVHFVGFVPHRQECTITHWKNLDAPPPHGERT